MEEYFILAHEIYLFSPLTLFFLFLAQQDQLGISNSVSEFHTYLILTNFTHDKIIIVPITILCFYFTL